MKIAIVHDWLTTYRGGERVVEELLRMYPEADLFSIVDFMEDRDRHMLQGRVPKTSFIQRMPFARKRYRAYLPLMMAAIEQFDLSNYDLVISSSSAVAKGVITGPGQVHVSYVHSPIRYAWDLQHIYLREAGLDRGLRGLYARALLHYVRMWDQRTANGVDCFVANSGFIATRIWKTYRREARVVYPPVDTNSFTPTGAPRGSCYLTASGLVPYKRVPMIAEAFAAMPDKKLVVVGDGPEMPALRKAAGPNVEVLGYQSHDELLRLFRSAKAFVFAAEEDFGITLVEAQACGTPVIAYGRGGALESIRGLDHDQPTGVFFPEQTPASLVEAVGRFEAHADRFDATAIRDNALRFAPSEFRRRMLAVIDAELSASDTRSLRFRRDADAPSANPAVELVKDLGV
ncbi:glycosyltransferase family 4 protein [Sphingomonas sp. Leaf257]|uniref:glycosyltransferase family 4 protein n=1 Tax=Sphingomonas sp. Leaf257 TaxID=1736309 RepID=UPI0006FD2982|nr:glycosyltransferase family 4 protein [Sphingomonas sp. Leaf257]KQO54503.1 hypothetical protein ASF14_20065 [Sphingomonas sp. Leaf257]